MALPLQATFATPTLTLRDLQHYTWYIYHKFIEKLQHDDETDRS